MIQDPLLANWDYSEKVKWHEHYPNTEYWNLILNDNLFYVKWAQNLLKCSKNNLFYNMIQVDCVGTV